MRTTLLLPDDLMREVKSIAAQESRTVTSLVEEALRAAVARRHAAPRAQAPFRIDVVHGRGLQPGVDLADTADLLDRMEGR